MSEPGIPYPLDPDNVLERYRHVLGEFIHDFAWMEVCLVHLLCAVAGISDKIGPALFSGSRAAELISLIRRCYAAHDREVEPYLNSALAQITVLNTARNEVVHFTTFGIEDSDEAVLATNQFRYMPNGVKNRLLTPEVLYAMSKDARIIPAMLNVAEAEHREPGSTGQLPSEMTASLRPWNYKPPAQATPRRKGK